jgi:hypothetical protein
MKQLRGPTSKPRGGHPCPRGFASPSPLVDNETANAEFLVKGRVADTRLVSGSRFLHEEKTQRKEVMAVVWRGLRAGLATVMATLCFGGSVSAQAQRWADVGKVSAVTVSSRTIVVEAPRGKDNLTVGAEVLPEAVIEAAGQRIGLAEVKVGACIRIAWSRGDHNNRAHRIVVLQQPGK